MQCRKRRRLLSIELLEHALEALVVHRARLGAGLDSTHRERLVHLGVGGESREERLVAVVVDHLNLSPRSLDKVELPYAQAYHAPEAALALAPQKDSIAFACREDRHARDVSHTKLPCSGARAS